MSVLWGRGAPLGHGDRASPSACRGTCTCTCRRACVHVHVGELGSCGTWCIGVGDMHFLWQVTCDHGHGHGPNNPTMSNPRQQMSNSRSRTCCCSLLFCLGGPEVGRSGGLSQGLSRLPAPRLIQFQTLVTVSVTRVKTRILFFNPFTTAFLSTIIKTASENGESGIGRGVCQPRTRARPTGQPRAP